MKPIIAILMPFKNAQDYLGEAIESLRSQNFKDWQLIMVHDHSEDGSLSIAQDFLAADPRISLYQNPGKGIVPALNEAFKHCQATYVSRFDADDIMPQGRLQKMYDLILKANPKTIVTGMVQYFSDRPISKGYQKYQQWLNEINISNQQWLDLYRECVIASPNWLMRSEELAAIGAFENLEYPEDYDWCFRCYQHGFEIECLHSTTLLWREHPSRTSRNSSHYDQDSFFRLKIKRFLELESFTELVLWGSGRKARLTASLLEEHQVSFRWMDLEPNRFPDGIHHHKIEDFRSLQPSPGLKLLVGVYPNPSERRSIEDFLFSRRLKPGEDYWYL